jgi:hypothetical protein
MSYDAVIIEEIQALNKSAPSHREAREIRAGVKARFDDGLSVNIQHSHVGGELSNVLGNLRAPSESRNLARRLLSLLANTYGESFAGEILQDEKIREVKRRNRRSHANAKKTKNPDSACRLAQEEA